MRIIDDQGRANTISTLGDTFIYTIEVSGKYLNYTSPITIHHQFPSLPSTPAQVISPVNPNIIVGPSGFDWVLNATDLPVNITVKLTTIPICAALTAGQFSTNVTTYSRCTQMTSVASQSPSYLFNNVQQFANTIIFITTNVNPGPYETGLPDDGDMIQNGYEGDFISIIVSIDINSTESWSNAYYRSDFLTGESLVNGTLKINLNDGNGYVTIPSSAVSGSTSVSLAFLTAPTYFNSTTIGKKTFSITYQVTFDDSAFSKSYLISCSCSCSCPSFFLFGIELSEHSF